MTDERLSDLAAAMTREMQALEIWSETAPSPRALASTVPFCYDTLQFDEWLQWVFLPRIRALAASGARLPAKSDIAPLAEVWFIEQEMAEQAAGLVALIRRIDRLLGDDYVQAD